MATVKKEKEMTDLPPQPPSSTPPPPTTYKFGYKQPTLTTPRLILTAHQPSDLPLRQLLFDEVFSTGSDIVTPRWSLAATEAIIDLTERNHYLGAPPGRPYLSYTIKLRPQTSISSSEGGKDGEKQIPEIEEEKDIFTNQQNSKSEPESDLEKIGHISFFTRPENTTPPEIGFGIIRAHQSKGYITEALTALITYLHSIHITEFVALTGDYNVPCQKVLEKAGFKRGGFVMFDGIYEDRSVELRAYVREGMEDLKGEKVVFVTGVFYREWEEKEREKRERGEKESGGGVEDGEGEEKRGISKLDATDEK